jgi:hypothetical protein
MLCPSCSAEIADKTQRCPVCHKQVAASLPPTRGLILAIAARYVFLPIIILLASSYLIFFVVELKVSPIVVILIFCAIVFPFGFGLHLRSNCGVVIACALGLLVGLSAVTAMSTLLFVMLGQEFFPDKRQIQDFFETSFAIMLAYAAGSATADFTEQVFPDAAHSTFSEFARRVIELSRGGASLTDRLRSLESVIKALVAIVLAFGALVVAVKKLFWPM